MVDAITRIVAALGMLVVLSIAGHTPAFAQPTWVEQGPGPILFDSNTKIPPNSPVSGAINAIAASPTDPDLVYVGTVNGGMLWDRLLAARVHQMGSSTREHYRSQSTF
jgi:hypothetical protein